MFVLSLKNGAIDPTKDSFDKYYMPLAEIKDFNALLDNKAFFDPSVKKKKKEEFEMSKLFRLFVPPKIL